MESTQKSLSQVKRKAFCLCFLRIPTKLERFEGKNREGPFFKVRSNRITVCLDLITKWDRISIVANWTVSFAFHDIEITLVTPIFSPRIFDNPILIAIWRCSISNHGYCMSNIIAETPIVLNNLNHLCLR